MYLITEAISADRQRATAAPGAALSSFLGLARADCAARVQPVPVRQAVCIPSTKGRSLKVPLPPCPPSHDGRRGHRKQRLDHPCGATVRRRDQHQRQRHVHPTAKKRTEAGVVRFSHRPHVRLSRSEDSSRTVRGSHGFAGKVLDTQRVAAPGLGTASHARLSGELGINPSIQAGKGLVLKERMAHCRGLLA
jgi:hypothetical protein